MRAFQTKMQIKIKKISKNKTPVSAVLFRCVVTETDIPFHYDDGHVRLTSLMKIKLQKRYGPDRFTFKILNDEYGIFAVRGPRGVPHSLSEALKE